MFEEFYKSELARRLLLQRFSSIDLEKAAIARLKTVQQLHNSRRADMPAALTCDQSDLITEYWF